MTGFPSPSFVEKFKSKAPTFEGGEELLRRLEQRGCLEFILIDLELYCGARVESATKESIRKYRSRRILLEKRLDKLAKLLTKVAKNVELINRVPEVTQQLASYGPQPFSLPNEIRSYVSILPRISKYLHDISLRAAPMDALRQLAEVMKGGARKVNRSDLALLLEIGYAAFGVKKVVSPEDVRQRLKGASERQVEQRKKYPIRPPICPPRLLG